MAQYYQVTSLEDLHRLYPNLQLENVEGIQCMIQDDQITHCTDVQGQQIIAAVDQTKIHVPQTTVTLQQCTQQNQFVLHQPTQYIIQQIESSEPQLEGIQYVQQIQKTPQKDEEDENRIVGCITSNQDEKLLNQCFIKADSNKQNVAHVQTEIHQPIKIHQQIQTVDVGSNILVLQSSDQDIVMSNEKPELSINPQEKQHNVIIQRQQHRPLLQINSQVQHAVHVDENSPLKFTQGFVNTNSTCHTQQLPKNSDQQIMQKLKYCNQVTVIDGLPQSTVEQSTMTENISKQTQVVLQPQQQHFKIKRVSQATGVPAVYQQQQIIIPQRLEISSPPPLTSRISQCKKKELEKEIETSGSVLIVQKFESPVVIRQPQTKLRLQTSNTINEKLNEATILPVSKQLEKNSNTAQIGQEIIHIKPTGLQTQNQSDSPEKSQSVGIVKVGIIEQLQSNRVIEQVNKPKIASGTLSRIITNEEQTDAVLISNRKEFKATDNEKFGNSASGQAITPTQNVQIHRQIPFKGTAIRGGHVVQQSGIRQQHNPKVVRGVQVQTSLPASNPEGSVFISSSKLNRPVNRGGKTVYSVGLDQRQAAMQQGTSQVVLQKNETIPTPNETIEEARILVLLLNGEKKMIRIPVSQQSIFLGQILQQAGVTVTSPISVEQVVSISNPDQITSKNSAGIGQNSQVSKLPHSTLGAPCGVTTAIVQQSPSTQRITTNLSIPRHHLEIPSSRLNVATSVPSTNLNTQALNSHPKGTQGLTQLIPVVKEEPRFVKGFMAICPFCGIQSLDFNKCIRCRRKLPENVKSQSIFDVKIIKSERSSTDSEKTNTKHATEGKDIDSSLLDGKGKVSALHDKKKARPCIKKKKLAEEPAEILILSSDEEEESKLKKADVIKPNSSILKKEPVYAHSELLDRDMNSTKSDSCLNEDLMKNIQPGSYTTLQCRTIRIGSYKVQPKERVLISSKGIRLVVTSLKNENVILIIPTNDIVKILLHFGKQIPVLFIYPVPKVAIQIRSILGMEDKMGPYYDPVSSEEETHKRITLLLEKISEENKIILHNIFGQEKLDDLSEKEANEILIRASPLDIQNTLHIRSTDSVRKIMVYPPPPEKGGIALNNQDYACLGEDQFLNDVIIDFYLKYLLLKVLSPEDRNRTHVFSTFFYKRLTTKPKAIRKNDPENDPKLSPAEKRHMRVKGWTKQVNLFEKDFIIVPINEHSHWFLAIICFPGLTGPVRFSDNTPVEPEEVLLKKNAESLQIGNTTITHIIKSDGNTVSLEMDCGSDRDEAEGDQDDLHPSSEDDENEQGEEETSSNSRAVEIPLLAPVSELKSVTKEVKTKSVKRKLFKEPIKQPCILIFDSLAGASRVRVVATLRDYLKVEFKAKMGRDRDFSKDTIKGAVPKVPQQNNFTDCGLYVLQYVESFFQDPLRDFKLPLKYLQEWFPEEVVSCKRQKLANLIRSLMQEQGLNVEEMGLPVLTFTNGNNSTSRMEDDEEEDDEDEEGLKNRVQTSDFDNEDDEDMELGGYAEDEDDEDIDEEELEVGEIPRHWLGRTVTTCNEVDSSIEQGECTNRSVDNEELESEEESYMSNTPDMFVSNQTTSSTEVAEGGGGSGSGSTVETNLSVPVSGDFEFQISQAKIKNVNDNKNLTEMIVSDGGECEIEFDVEDTSHENSSVDLNSVNQNVPLLEKTYFQSSEPVLIDGKTYNIDIIKKLVNEKKITIRRKEEDNVSNVFKKHLEFRPFKTEDCDTTQDAQNTSTLCATTQAMNSSTNKRTYQALKSVRIPKKAERKLESPDTKRQKVDET